MADIDLPVFSFRPNWKEGVTERLAFLTDVLRSSLSGAEQRRALRPTPRRVIETDYMVKGPERTYHDLFMNSLSGSEIMIPLYWDVVRLTSATVAGVTARIDFDNTFREFAEGLGILMGKTALDFEVVEIAATDDTGIDLAAPTERAWPRGTLLLPLRRGIIEDMGDPAHHTAGLAIFSAQTRLTVPNPWTPAADESPTYLDKPVFLNEPNWVEPLSVNHSKEIVRFDTELGIPYQVDPLGRALVGQSHRWFLPGRERLAEFRDLIYRHQGRAGSFWLPTFKHDLQLVNSPGSGATQIEVKNAGYGLAGGPTSGREYIAIKHAGGTILRKVNSVIPGTTSATEKVNLDAALGLALSPSLARRISFVDVARFDQDEFEIIHHAGLDGLAECNAMFRTFKDVRTAPDPINYPIPATSTSDTPCGEDPGDCYYVDPGDWFFKFRYVVIDPGPSTGNGQCNVIPSPTFGAGAVSVGSTNATSRPVSRTYYNSYPDELILEYTYYVEPPEGVDWEIWTQHGSGTVPSYSRGKFQVMRIGDSGFTDVICYSGYGVTPGDPVFDIQGNWPNYRHFIFD